MCVTFDCVLESSRWNVRLGDDATVVLPWDHRGWGLLEAVRALPSSTVNLPGAAGAEPEYWGTMMLILRCACDAKICLHLPMRRRWIRSQTPPPSSLPMTLEPY
jgi:hypothetical protein